MKKNGIIIFIILAVFLVKCKTDQEYEYASITFFIGDVKKNNVSVQIGDIVKENDVIVTAGQSSCDIKIGKSIIRIKGKSTLKFTELIAKNGLEKTGLGLSIGKVLCKPKKLLKGENFQVKTPTAIAAVRGTQFTVEADIKKTTRIKVFEGKVKVAKRVSSVEDKIDQILEKVPALNRKEQVVITVGHVKAAEKAVAKLVSKNASLEEFSKVLNKVRNKVAVKDRQITAFKPEDFINERSEIIAIKEKPAKIIKAIKRILKLDRSVRADHGRLLITRYEVYYVKDGKINWVGAVSEKAIIYKNKVFIASEDFVFCASAKGSVFWKMEIEEAGKLKFKENNVIVSAKEGVVKLDLNSGKRL